MKSFFTFMLMITALQASAATLDDLGTINLSLEESSVPTELIGYPGDLDVLTDCLILDIKNSAQPVSKTAKLKLAKRLVVQDGYIGNVPTLKPERKGSNIVFRLVSTGGTYNTRINVKTKNGLSLNSNINAVITRAENAYKKTLVGLIYVRGCRL